MQSPIWPGNAAVSGCRDLHLPGEGLGETCCLIPSAGEQEGHIPPALLVAVIPRVGVQCGLRSSTFRTFAAEPEPSSQREGQPGNTSMVISLFRIVFIRFFPSPAFSPLQAAPGRHFLCLEFAELLEQQGSAPEKCFYALPYHKHYTNITHSCRKMQGTKALKPVVAPLLADWLRPAEGWQPLLHLRVQPDLRLRRQNLWKQVPVLQRSFVSTELTP